MKSINYFWAFFVGVIIPIQAIIGARLSSYVGGFAASFLNFFIGGIVLFLSILVTGIGAISYERLQSVPPYLYSAGIIGAFFIFSAIKLVPNLGAMSWTALIIAGQLISTLLMDHYGVLGLEVKSINTMRLVGASILFLGAFLIIKN